MLVGAFVQFLYGPDCFTNECIALFADLFVWFSCSVFFFKLLPRV